MCVNFTLKRFESFKLQISQVYDRVGKGKLFIESLSLGKESVRSSFREEGIEV